MVIEHNLDVVKTADYVIDLGPEGGDEGGKVIGTGTPEEIAELQTATAKFLRKILKANVGPAKGNVGPALSRSTAG